MNESALNPPEPYSAIIFDCDGTIVDSTRLYFRAWNTLFKSHGVEMPWAWFTAHLGFSWPQILDEYQKECGIVLDATAALQEFNRAYRNAMDTLSEIEIVAEVARRHFPKGSDGGRVGWNARDRRGYASDDQSAPFFQCGRDD